MDEYELYGDGRLPPDLDDRIRAELSAGERLLWVGQPDPRRAARSVRPVVLFAIPFTGFAVFWIVAATWMMGGAGPGGGNGPGGVFGAVFACFPLFGIPFVLVGLGMFTAPFWARRWARQTCYGLTDRRAIVRQARWFGGVEVRSYGPESLTKLRRTEYPDGTGDLVFEELISYGRDGDGHRTTNITRYGFMSIPNVREVEELLRRALRPDDRAGGPGGRGD